MAKNRYDKKLKFIGDYHTIINNYLRTKKVTLTPQGLNNALKVTRDDIYITDDVDLLQKIKNS